MYSQIDYDHYKLKQLNKKHTNRLEVLINFIYYIHKDLQYLDLFHVKFAHKVELNHRVILN